MKSTEEVVILDTAGILSGHLAMLGGRVFTVESVISEVRDRESSYRLEMAISAGKLVVARPGRESINRILSTAASRGLDRILSRTDIEVAALALEMAEKGFKVVVITDDSVLHTLCKILGIKSAGARRRTPSTYRPRMYVCRVCGYRSWSRIDRCPSCGSPLKASTAEGDSL